MHWKFCLIFAFVFQALRYTPNGEITAFAVALHTHSLGIETKLRHIRDGVELQPIAEDKYHDFNYQNVFTLQNERVIQPVDFYLYILLNISSYGTYVC